MAEKSSFPTVPHAKIFLGTSYTGKTQSLLNEMGSLLRGGVDASEMLVFCASPDAAQNLSARLRVLCQNTKEIEVTTPRAFFLDLVGTKEACAAIGRKARLLLPFEYDFFLEDLKTSGIRPHRLREILRFLYKGLSELADDDEEWLITSEERELFDLMKACLTFTGAILEPELANLAVKYLESNKQAWEGARKAFVFVDDFQLLSRASQFASCLLAKECLYLSASQDVVIEAYESYPYSDGVDEFIQANPAAACTRLATSYSCYSSAKASCALRKENGIDVSTVEVEHLKTDKKASFRLIEGKTPHDEIAQIVDAVAQLLHDGFSAHDIVVAAPHPAWARYLVRQMQARDVPAEELLDVRFLKGDIRRNERSFNARFLTALSLIADPTDAVAWRCWCGFGDYLTNSNGMRLLRNLGQTQGSTLDSVLGTSDSQLDALDGPDAIASTQRIVRARDEARALIDQLSGLDGEELLERIAKNLVGHDARVPEEIKSLVAGCEDDGENKTKNKSAVSMARRVRLGLEFPIYYGTDVVRVASYKNLIGMNPCCLFLTGFMNGFFPKHDYFDSTVLTVEQREKRYANNLNHIASIVAKASDTFVVSYSKKLDLEDAKRLELAINRINFENNKQVAKTEPSIFLKLFTVG